jgi:hypothetical protein
MSRLSRPYCTDIGSYGYCESPERGYDGTLKRILCFSRGLLDSRHISASINIARTPVVQAPSILDQSKATPAGEFEVSDVPDYRALRRTVSLNYLFLTFSCLKAVAGLRIPKIMLKIDGRLVEHESV